MTVSFLYFVTFRRKRVCTSWQPADAGLTPPAKLPRLLEEKARTALKLVGSWLTLSHLRSLNSGDLVTNVQIG